MISVFKNPELSAKNFPFGIVEVQYPPQEKWRAADFYALANRELSDLADRFPDYDRKTVFGDNPYFRFFKKFKKTYPVALQFESVVIKKLPFPRENPVTAVPFLLELTTHVLSGTHDIDRLQGAVELYLAADKTPFSGMHGKERHTYPGDFCARDEAGIIFSAIAGTDDRTCARPESRHVFYPVFGTPELPAKEIRDAIDRLINYIRLLAPTADVAYRVL